MPKPTWQMKRDSIDQMTDELFAQLDEIKTPMAMAYVSALIEFNVKPEGMKKNEYNKKLGELRHMARGYVLGKAGENA
jgi:hypothetical protein